MGPYKTFVEYLCPYICNCTGYDFSVEQGPAILSLSHSLAPSAYGVQVLAVLEMNWHNTSKPAEIFYVDSLPSSDLRRTEVMLPLIKWLGLEFIKETVGPQAALAEDVASLPDRLRVCMSFLHPYPMT